MPRRRGRDCRTRLWRCFQHWQNAGLQPHSRPSPTRRGGAGPRPDVWRSDMPAAERGLMVSGVPISHAEYVRTWADSRVREEWTLLAQLPQLPDLQYAWLLLAMCASPRANHALRTVGNFGRPPLAPHEKKETARALAGLPAALGGLGLLPCRADYAGGVLGSTGGCVAGSPPAPAGLR